MDTEHDPEISVVIRITYPTAYAIAVTFPFTIKVQTKSDTATGKPLYTKFLSNVVASC